MKNINMIASVCNKDLSYHAVKTVKVRVIVGLYNKEKHTQNLIFMIPVDGNLTESKEKALTPLLSIEGMIDNMGFISKFIDILAGSDEDIVVCRFDDESIDERISGATHRIDSDFNLIKID